MAVDPKAPPLPLVVQYPVLPVVMRPRSPEDVELEMRLLSAARLDAPEAIAEVQSIAAELAGMVSVADATDAVIAEAPSIAAKLARAAARPRRPAFRRRGRGRRAILQDGPDRAAGQQRPR